MKVESITECLGAVCNTLDLHLAIIDLETLFLVILRAAVLHRVYCRGHVTIKAGRHVLERCEKKRKNGQYLVKQMNF